MSRWDKYARARSAISAASIASRSNDLRIALVGCGKEKLLRPAPAREFYTGNLFRAALAHAEAEFEHVFVLSARYGLVELDQTLDPYDLRIDDLDREDQANWAHEILAWSLAERFSTKEELELVVFAGSAYVVPLSWQMPEFPRWKLTDPLAGLSIGERLRWFNERRAA